MVNERNENEQNQENFGNATDHLKLDLRSVTDRLAID